MLFCLGLLPGPNMPDDFAPYLTPLAEELMLLHEGLVIDGDLVQVCMTCVSPLVLHLLTDVCLV